MFRGLLYGQYAKGGAAPLSSQTRRVVFVGPPVVVAMALSRSRLLPDYERALLNMNNIVKARIIFKFTKRNDESVTKK